jgi:hypothetical protein
MKVLARFRVNRLDPDTARRLLDGMPPDDAPPGYGGVAAVLRAAAGPPTAGEREAPSALATRLAAALDKGVEPPRVRVKRGVPTRAFAGAFAGSVALFGGAAVAGALPASIQRFAATTLGHVGIDVPEPSGSVIAPPRGSSGDDTSSSDQPPAGADGSDGATVAGGNEQSDSGSGSGIGTAISHSSKGGGGEGSGAGDSGDASNDNSHAGNPPGTDHPTVTPPSTVPDSHSGGNGGGNGGNGGGNSGGNGGGNGGDNGGGNGGGNPDNNQPTPTTESHGKAGGQP